MGWPFLLLLGFVRIKGCLGLVEFGGEWWMGAGVGRLCLPRSGPSLPVYLPTYLPSWRYPECVYSFHGDKAQRRFLGVVNMDFVLL